MQDLVPRRFGVRGLAGLELFEDLLHGGAGVRGLHVRGHGAQNVIVLAVGLDLKAEL